MSPVRRTAYRIEMLMLFVQGFAHVATNLDRDGDPDEITIRLEVIEVTEEVYPGE